MQTHENYIQAIANAAIHFGDLNPSERDNLRAIKLVYGSGPAGTRGVTFFNRFKPAGSDQAVPFVEISAFGQESEVQLAGTCVHELGHVLAGWDAGHGKGWKHACERLGLRCVKAAGTAYAWSMFEARLRDAITSLPKPSEGQPIVPISFIGTGPIGTQGTITTRPCGAGIGTRGGRSRGTGSGSRLKLYQCGCGQKIRAASTVLDATHNPCGTAFVCK